VSSPLPLLILTGPSASGKGSVAFELATRSGLEVALMDSMKVYREIDVASAKPSADRRRRVRYHLLDLVTPDLEFSVGDYLPRLEKVLETASERGTGVMLAGGTALYLKGFLDGLLSGPPADWQLRQALREEARLQGLAALHERLRSLDPEAAARISPEDERRILRALEVHALTGRPISASWRWRTDAPRRVVRLFGLGWERSELYERADRRVLRMVGEGLFEEVEALRARCPPLGRSASQCIGFKELSAGMGQGLGRDEIVARIQQSTRRFIKRQMTWFRKMEIEWLPVSGEIDPVWITDEILRKLEA
jgi:tRNA dimethylallyltransferase